MTQRATGDREKLTGLHSHLERLFADVLMYVRLLVKVGQSAFRKSERGYKAVMYIHNFLEFDFESLSV